MLKLNPNPTFSAEVSITVPGEKEPGTVTLVFKYLGRKDFAEFLKRTGEEKDDNDKVVKPAKSDIEVFSEIVLGWDIPDEFSPKNVAIFLDNYPAAAGEVYTQYARLLFESRVKN